MPFDNNLLALLATTLIGLGGSLLVAWLAGKQAGNSAAAAVMDAQNDTIATQQTRIGELETKVASLWDAREVDAIKKRQLGDFIDVLERHIWDDKGPPPPTRPAGI